jgi:hypothetical protein
MGEAWTKWPEGSAKNAKLRVARLAGPRQGRITTAQLVRLGVGRTTIGDWTVAGYLHPRLPGVYAVGSAARTVESDLWEAVLYAGPGAMLSHGTAAWWRDLIDFPVYPKHVSTPRRKRPLPGIAVHGRRAELARDRHKGIPVTSIAQTVFDLATQGEIKLVRKALANLDYAHSLHAPAIRAMCGPGRPGSVALQWAIDNYEPLFAQTQSPLEDDYIELCESLDIPKPDRISVRVHGIPSDAVYYDAMLIVELDGVGNHHSPAQINRDHRNDKKLRDEGWKVLRYTTDQLAKDPEGWRDYIIREHTQRGGGAGRAGAV